MSILCVRENLEIVSEKKSSMSGYIWQFTKNSTSLTNAWRPALIEGST